MAWHREGVELAHAINIKCYFAISNAVLFLLILGHPKLIVGMGSNGVVGR